MVSTLGSDGLQEFLHLGQQAHGCLYGHQVPELLHRLDGFQSDITFQLPEEIFDHFG